MTDKCNELYPTCNMYGMVFFIVVLIKSWKSFQIIIDRINALIEKSQG